MGDRDKSRKVPPRSSSPNPLRDHRIRPVIPAPDPLPGPSRGRGDLPHPPSHLRDRLREIFVLPPIREMRPPTSPHPNRRIIIELPAGPQGRIWRKVKSRVPTPYDNWDQKIKRKPKSHSVSEGILPSVDVGGAVGIGDNIQKPPSNYGCVSMDIPMQDETVLHSSGMEVQATGFRHSMGNLFRSFTQRLRGYIAPFLGYEDPSIEFPPPPLPAVAEGSDPSSYASLSTHSSLESGSLYLPNAESSDNSDSETDESRRPVNVPVAYSSEESLPKTDSDGSRASGSVDNKQVVPSSEDLPREGSSDSDKSPIAGNEDSEPVLHSLEDTVREDRPAPDSDRSLTPEGPVPVPYSTEAGIVREDPLSDIEQAAYLAHVNPSGALSVETTDEAVLEDLYNIRVGSPINIQIAYEDSGCVTTCLRCEPARYVLDEDDAQSDREDSRSDDDVYF